MKFDIFARDVSCLATGYYKIADIGVSCSITQMSEGSELGLGGLELYYHRMLPCRCT